MLKGCGLSLFLLLAIAGAYMVAFDQVFPRPEGLIFGAVAGVVTFFCFGALTNAWTAWSDGSLISKSEFGLQLNDGCKVAVAGRIRAEGEPLKAPFSGKECVVCEYDVSQAEAGASDDDDAASDYAGFLMSPCQIETSWGNVRLLSFPLVDKVLPENCLSPKSIRAAREFLRTNEFEDRSGMNAVSILSVFNDVWSDDDGRVARHLRLSSVLVDEILPPGIEEIAQSYQEVISTLEHLEDLDEETLDEGARLLQLLPTLAEKRVETGEQVVVFGTYDETHRGLLPRKGSTNMNRMMRGMAEEVSGQLRRSARKYVIGGLLVLALLHGVIAYSVINFAKSKQAAPPVDNDVRRILPGERQYV